MFKRTVLYGLFLALLPAILSNHAGNGLPVIVIEMRRTFNASDCATGEVYIGGQLAGLFSTSPSGFYSNLTGEQARLGVISKNVSKDPLPHLTGIVPGLVFKSDTEGDSIFYFTESRGYTIYDRPRKLSRVIPSDTFIIGTSLENRECGISSPEESTYYAVQGDYASSSITMNKLLYEGDAAEEKISQRVIIIYTDASDVFEIKSENVSFKQIRPIRSAQNISKGDLCLSKTEDLSNTIISLGVQTYHRHDDVWFCTEGPLLLKDSSTSAIEKRSDLRYIELYTYESCGNLLGLPMVWQIVVERDSSGRGGGIWYRCSATEPWQQVSKLSTITFK